MQVIESKTKMEESLQPQGYSYEFVPQLDRKYECPICLLCRKDTVRTILCGHKFCQECILTWLRTKKKCCPTDAIVLTDKDIIPDIHEQQEILTLKVKCPQAKNGCSAIMELGKMQSHESVCSNTIIFCPVGCLTKIYRKDVESHLENCKNQKVACCKEEFPEIQENVSCEYCNVLVSPEDITKHIQLDCQRAIVPCQFAHLGCPYSEVERQHLLKHKERCIFTHVELLLKELTKLSTEHSRVNNAVETERVQVEGCSFSGNKLKHTNQPEPTVPDYENILKVLYQKNLQLCSENVGLSNTVKLLQKKVTSLEEKTFQGIYYWRLQNFSSFEDETFTFGFKEHKSSAFYTGPYGYRVSLRTKLGSKENRDYSLSLFVHLMQGDNDDLLPWPFSGKIELSILDQQVNEEYRIPILETMCSNPQLDAFQRPTKEFNTKGFGYKEFANNEILHDERRNYLKNNTLIIRAEVVPIMLL